jgi:hypothetical protein
MILAETWNFTAFKEHRQAVMTVGGWFDAEDLYGPLNTYSTIEKTVKTITLLLWGLGVMAIGQKSKQVIGNINFGDSISGFIKT